MGSFLYFIAAAVLLGTVAYVLFTYLTGFLLHPEVWRGPRLVRAAVVEILVSWLLLPVLPFRWFIPAKYRPAQPGDRRPIVLLHGFGMNTTHWIWMARSLSRRGNGPIHCMNYFSPQSVEKSARELEQFVRAVLECERAEQVDIIAHSLGGIVARMYIEQLNGAAQVARLITLGTPHHGTRLGRFAAVLPAARELLANSTTLNGLGRKQCAAYVSIWSRADAIVQPAISSSIAPDGLDVVFNDLGHLSLLVSPRVFDVIDAQLRK